MANLREIRKRIDSVSTTKQITRTMEMVSSAKISRALTRAKESEPYRRAITDVMFTVAGQVAAGSAPSPLLENPETYERALIIAISSDRGLAGGFNIQVERAVERRIDHFRRHGAREIELITCGRKVTEYFQDYPNLVMSVTGESDMPSFQHAQEIAEYALDGFATGALGRIDHRRELGRRNVARRRRRLDLSPMSFHVC